MAHNLELMRLTIFWELERFRQPSPLIMVTKGLTAEAAMIDLTPEFMTSLAGVITAVTGLVWAMRRKP